MGASPHHSIQAMASSRKLESASEKLRARTIGWEGYSRAGDITQEELQLILKLAKQPKQSSDQILANDLDTYIKLLLRLLSTSHRTDAVQWSLTMLGDIVIGKDESQAKALIAAQPWESLLRHLDSQDEFSQLKSATILSLLLPSESSPDTKVAGKLIRTLGAFLRQTPENQDVALQCLGEVLRSHGIRMSVWNSETSEKGKSAGDGETKVLAGLTSMLESINTSSAPVSPQTQYQVAFCFWLLSFELEIAEQIETKFGIIPLLSELCKRAVKEKVVRVILSTFRNLLTLAPAPNKPALLMASSGMLGFTQSLMMSKRFFGDDEVKEDTEWLRDYLKAASRELTTWDEYVAEIDSKQLSWTPPHTDDEFWSENARKLTGNSNEVLRKLLALASPQSAPLVNSVVCSDLVKFIKFFPDPATAKKEIQKLGGKVQVLQLMNENPDPEVRYKALVVVQMLVSQSWAS